MIDEWHRRSNNLVVLRVDTEDDLIDWAVAIQEDGKIPCVIFREPDLDDQATAVAVAPTDSQMLRELPLAG